jgi:chromosomal replication initiation ATPase DnaA
MARPLRIQFDEALYHVIAMWTMWQICDLTLREISAIFNGMDHAAVAQRVRRIDRDDTVQGDLRKLLRECQNV